MIISKSDIYGEAFQVSHISNREGRYDPIWKKSSILPSYFNTFARFQMLFKPTAMLTATSSTRAEIFIIFCSVEKTQASKGYSK